MELIIIALMLLALVVVSWSMGFNIGHDKGWREGHKDAEKGILEMIDAFNETDQKLNSKRDYKI